jgi:hypothetical protein
MLDLVQWVLAGNGRGQGDSGSDTGVSDASGGAGCGEGEAGGSGTAAVTVGSDVSIVNDGMPREKKDLSGTCPAAGDGDTFDNDGLQAETAATPISSEAAAATPSEATAAAAEVVEAITKVPCVRLDGSMSREQRDKALRRFRNSTPGGGGGGGGGGSSKTERFKKRRQKSSHESVAHDTNQEEAAVVLAGESFCGNGSSSSNSSSSSKDVNNLKKTNNVNKFKDNNEPFVLLASLKACGVGLNLTCASVIVLLDLWWNPAVENQAIDRVHRFGQTQVVVVVSVVILTIVHFFLSNPTENRSVF